MVWLGDLNYRISLPESKTRVLVDNGEWNALLENDQVPSFNLSNYSVMNRILYIKSLTMFYLHKTYNF